MSASSRENHPGTALSEKSDDSRYLVFGRVADQIDASLRAGRRPDVEVLVAQHPEMAEEIRQLVSAQVMLYELGHAPEDPSTGTGPTSSDASVPGQLGDYRILRQIGRGGMGVVYEAEQISLDRRVALKVLPFAAVLDPKHLQRFKNEARAAASLDHPHIVHVHSVGCERAVHFYAMQYIEGQTLAEVIRQVSGVRDQESGDRVTGRRGDGVTKPTPTDSPRHPVTPSPPHPPPDTSPLAALSTETSTRTPEFFRTVAHLGIQAAEALEHAHGMGVVHRDIKPSNLMVDARGHLWITDFGLAMTHTETNLTMTGDLLGTLRYMSPEQVQAKHGVLDHRTDVYSLGLTLYELLTLQPAFPGDDRQKLLRQVAEDDPRPPRQLNSAIPPDLETIILKATAKEPESRYATAQELAEDLRRFVEDKPIQARRPTLAARAAKWSRRHRPVVWSAVLLLVVTTIGMTVSTLIIAQESARAEENLRLALEAVDEIYLQFAEDTFLELGADADARQEPIPAETEKFLKKALKFYEQFAEANRDNSSVRDETLKAYCRVGKIRCILGMSYEGQMAIRQGIEIGKELVSDYPNVADYRTFLARLHVYNGLACRGQKDLFGSIAQYNEAIRLDAKCMIAYGNRGVAYGDLGKFHNAIADCTEAIRLDPNVADNYFNRGRSHRRKGDLDQAIDDFDQAIRIDPEHAKAYWGRSLAYSDKGDVDAAIAYSSSAIEIHPNDPWLHNMLGIVHAYKGDLPQAMNCFNEAIRLNPDCAVYYNNRGIVYLRRREFLEAIADFDKAIRLHPGDWRPYDGRGDVYLRRGELDRAIKDYSQAILLDPERTLGRKGRAVARARLGQIDAALADVAKVAAIDPATPRHKNSTAWFLATCEDPRLRRVDRALELATRAVRFGPKGGEFWTTLGAVQYRAGNPKAAVEALQKSEELKYYRCGATWFFRAMAHWQLDQKQEAQRWYEKAVEWTEKNWPEDEELRRFRTEAEQLIEQSEKHHGGTEDTEKEQRE